MFNTSRKLLFFSVSDVVELLLGQANVELNQQVRWGFKKKSKKHIHE